jgi:hypothetical protein
VAERTARDTRISGQYLFSLLPQILSLFLGELDGQHEPLTQHAVELLIANGCATTTTTTTLMTREDGKFRVSLNVSSDAKCTIFLCW